ncbi:OX-2 membrane glycoprotein-like [Halichoeres trimaculatus]|uniref:OX-2 membrane glycoprotein-like n=1 Tax=Halichoeres trimaculatus TaxID=147232 RepID=UPI003D9F247B
MALNALVFFLYTLGVCQEGLTALIQTKRVVMAAAGDQVCLSCQLMEPREVHQVTWQKILPDGERNVATFSKYRGERVNPGFHGKVEFKDAGLQSSSIVVLKVTEQDEGCYRCLFNTYRERALTEETCLKLYELHGPFIHIMESNSSDKAVVSCSATARPAPTVTLRVLNLKLKSSNDSHSNKNGTVTFSTTAELQRAVEVECEVQVPSVDPKRVFETVPEVKPALFSRQEGETGSSLPVIGVVLSVVVVVLLGVLGVKILK